MIQAIGENNIIDIRCSEDNREKIEILIEGNNNTVVIDELVEISDKLKIYIVDNGSMISIGRGTTFEDTTISVADNNNKVVIGNDCMFARNTAILASDFHAIIDLNTGKRRNFSRGVQIDNHVWVGLGTTILKNSHIMSNSIVAAGAIITGKIGPNTISTRVKKYKKSEITWDRRRKSSFNPLPVKEKVNLSKIYKNNERKVIYNIETKCMKILNVLSGWACLENLDSEESFGHLLVVDKAGKIEIYKICMMNSEDVASVTDNQLYRHCRFEMYMPACVIENFENISKVEILLVNGFSWGKITVYEAKSM